MRLALPAIAIAFILLCGCVHITTDAECLSYSGEQRDRCYHEAALGHALQGDVTEAVNSCNLIRTEEMVDVQGTESVQTIAKGLLFGKGQHDACIMDVAEMTRSPEVCSNIEPTQEQPEGEIDPMESLCRDNASQPGEYKCFSTMFMLFALGAASAFYSKQ